jgi:hypothetical protein
MERLGHLRNLLMTLMRAADVGTYQSTIKISSNVNGSKSGDNAVAARTTVRAAREGAMRQQQWGITTKAEMAAVAVAVAGAARMGAMGQQWWR